MCYAIGLGAISILCGRVSAAEPDSTAQPIIALLRDGRSVTGFVDARTDAEHLWLRRTADGFDLVSGFAWDQILEGRTSDGHWSAVDLHTWAANHKQPGRLFSEVKPPRPVVRQSPSVRSSSPASFADSARVKTLVVKAELAQWDKDAQVDGLRIFVSPLDAQGNVVPVNGRIEFTLVAEVNHVAVEHSLPRRAKFIEGDRFSYSVQPEHFRQGAAFYELSFSKWHPEFEPNIAAQALLVARLSVPGQGVFEASDAQICLREPSRFRDQLQYFTPGRYLPLESNGQANR